MRVTVGAVAVLGLAVTVATAQPGKERAAQLKAPEPLAPGELPPTARGASDDFPTTLSSTPVPRSNAASGRASVATGPAWLSGVDPNVLPASGSTTKTGLVRPLTPPPSALAKEDAPVPPPKFLDRLKIFSDDKTPTPQTAPQPVSPFRPHPQPQPTEQPTANTPFRSTGVNGTPVFAGPPAYRWYGWGSVTPGANPLAPAGQYPKASANWYAITGATPGAFPVPVSDTGRIAPGTEPPTYGLAARQPVAVPVSVMPVTSRPQPALQFTERPEGSKFPASPGAGSLPPTFTPPGVPAPTTVPALTPPPIPRPTTVTAPALPPPTRSAPPSPPAPVTVAPTVSPVVAPPAGPVVPKSEPTAKLPPMPPVPALPPVVPAPTPVPSVEPVKTAAPATEPKSISATPAPLPTSVTTEPARDESNWKRSAEPSAPRPGTWAPAGDPAPLPTVPVEQTPSWQTGAAKGSPVARAQVPDPTPDPVVALIKKMCQDRAEGVEIRYTGTRKLQVCFEIRTADAAKKLVADISKRPELTAYQIDFCVLVK